MRKHRRLRGRRLKKQRRIILASIIGITLLMTAGYAAFGTNISITAKGNVQDRVDFYVSSNGSDTTGVGSITKPYATIGKAYDKAPSSATIYVMDDITAVSTTTMNSDKDIVLTSYSTNDKVNSIVRGSSLTNQVLKISKGNLDLNNITIDGNNVEATTSLISTTSTLNINSGTTLQKGKTSDRGGALTISGGTTTLNGGTISNNTATNEGGGIVAFSKLNIKEGSINNNKVLTERVSAGAGISCRGGCTVTMTGGSISSNNSSYLGGGVYIYSSGTFNLNGGSINNNIATANGGGVEVRGTLTMSSGTISGNTSEYAGGGINVQSNATFNISGGTISNNTATYYSGGVHYQSNSILNKTGGIICGNKPTNGFETHTTCP